MAFSMPSLVSPLAWSRISVDGNDGDVCAVCAIPFTVVTADFD